MAFPRRLINQTFPVVMGNCCSYLHNFSFPSPPRGNIRTVSIAVEESVVQESIVTKSPTEEYETFYLQAQFYTGLVAYPIVGLLGFVGSIICVVVMSQPQMKSSTNMYLLALAISDGVKLLSDLVYFFVVLLVHTNVPLGATLFAFVYPYAHYIFNASLCISAWLTVSVSAERYVYVCHPTKVKQFCSLSKAKRISITVFVVMSVFTVPYALRYQTVETYSNSTMVYNLNVTQLWRNHYFAQTFTWAQFLIRSVLPLLLLIILNCCIICGIRSCRRLDRGVGQRRYRITIMLLCVVLVFMLCTSPDAIMSSIFGFGYYEENFLRRGIREITDLLLLVNSATNFLLYCIFNTVFWQSFTSLFCRSCLQDKDTLAIFSGRTTNNGSQHASHRLLLRSIVQN